MVPTSTGCTYLNRGTAVPVTTADTLGHLHVAWANSDVDTTCADGGNIVRLQFAFDGCDDTPGCFRLNALTLLDDANAPTDVEIVGATATVLDGSASCDELDGSGGNSPPALDQVPDYTTLVGSTVTIDPSATDADGDTLTWSGQNLPAGASVNSATGETTWTPQAAGAYTGLSLSASDGETSSSSEFSIYAVEGGSDDATVDAAGNCVSKQAGVVGAFRITEGSSSWRADVKALGVKWTYRDVRPNLDTLIDVATGLPNWVVGADADVQRFQDEGIEVVFNLVEADSLYKGKYVSMRPTGADSALWDTVVTRLVERYDGDSLSDMPGLKMPVKYWHLEEEDTFWRDFATDSYVTYLNHVRSVIRAADSTAKVISMGLSSDNCWAAANHDGYVSKSGNQTCSFVDPNGSAFQNWLSRITSILQNGQQDIVDMHCYEIYPIIRGKLSWLRSLTSKPVWVFEAGGPNTDRQSCTAPEPYSDTLNGNFAWAQIAEAFGSGVERFAWAYKGKSNCDPSDSTFDCTLRFKNMALMDSIASIYHASVDSSVIVNKQCCADSSKPSFRNFDLMVDYLRGYTTAVDRTASSGDEADLKHVVEFQWPDTSCVGYRPGRLWVAWKPSGPSTVTITIPSSWTDSSLLVIRPTNVRDQGPALPESTSTLAVTNHQATIKVTSKRVIVTRSDFLTGIRLQAASPPMRPRLHQTRRGSDVILRWSAPGGPTPLAIEIFDVTGRCVHRAMVWRERAQAEGAYTWRAGSGPTRSPAGLYFARARVDRIVGPSERLLIVR